MTREEAINFLRGYLDEEAYTEKCINAHEMAIEALYTGFLKYEDIYNDFCKKFPDIEAEDYRPAIELYIPQLSKGIPNAIIVWIKDGSKVIYIAEDEG